MNIGSNIKKRRLELGMTQKELADKLGYKTRSTIAKIESGENDVSQKKLESIARSLDTTIEQLLFKNINLNKPSNKSFKNINIYRQRKNIAIILAGGKSNRNLKNIPNQFIDISGKPVFIYSLEAYESHPSIDDIYIVCLKGWESIVNDFSKKYNITKLKGIFASGSTGVKSIQNAIKNIKNSYKENDLIFIQESTRPLVNYDMITKLLQSSLNNESSTLVKEMSDYVQFNKNSSSVEYLERNSIYDLQSPEAHTLSKIINVFDLAQKKEHALSESCLSLLMYNLGFDLNFIVEASNNFKIIREDDIKIASIFLK